VAALKVGEWAADPAARGAGRLQVRRLANGSTAWYYRYTTPSGTRDRLPLGADLSLADARRVAADLSRRYQSGDRDLRGVLDAEERERERQRVASERAATVEAAAAAATLGALLTAYVDQLRSSGKPSAREVETAIERHVKAPWPELWATPAADVEMDDLLAVVARVADAGKLREAAKLRSYLRAAYAAAIRARQSAQGLQALRDLKITSNPARDLVTIEGASKAGERALSVAELRAYWRRIAAMPGAPGALLRFHLLTGGQRVRQLARLTTDDDDADTQCVRIHDSKGRRKVARIHDVPLIPAAAEALAAMGHELGPYLFTLSRGETPASYGSMRDHLLTVRAAMKEAGELEKGPFTVGDLRRTIETRLAAAGISKDDRSQLQSHGLGGVQGRHYDKYEYINEKRAALEALHRLLIGKPAKVATIRRKGARSARTNRS
jgi:hypothetical protein